MNLERRRSGRRLAIVVGLLVVGAAWGIIATAHCGLESWRSIAELIAFGLSTFLFGVITGGIEGPR